MYICYISCSYGGDFWESVTRTTRYTRPWHKFSKVSAVVYLLESHYTESTFENFVHRKAAARGTPPATSQVSALVYLLYKSLVFVPHESRSNWQYKAWCIKKTLYRALRSGRSSRHVRVAREKTATLCRMAAQVCVKRDPTQYQRKPNTEIMRYWIINKDHYWLLKFFYFFWICFWLLSMTNTERKRWWILIKRRSLGLQVLVLVARYLYL